MNVCTINGILNAVCGGFSLLSCLTFLRRNAQSLEATICSYRKIQLLTSRYNAIHRAALVPSYICHVIGFFTYATYVVLAHHQEVGFVGVTLFVTCGCLASGINFTAFGFYASVWKEGYLVLEMIGRLVKTRGKLFRCQHKALKPVRVEYPPTNFFGMVTPLLFFQWGITWAINLVLLHGF